MKKSLMILNSGLFACQAEKTEDFIDSDGDGLSDSAEIELGSDPNNTDSDGDGYQDGWEVTEGTNPTDPASKIYQGGWPYNPNKALIEESAWSLCSNSQYMTKFSCLGAGACSDAALLSQWDCEEEGSCSDSTIIDRDDCTDVCSDETHTNQSNCEDAGETWLPNEWTPVQTWTSDGETWSPPDIGDRIPNYVAVDQFGDLVNLYDFAGHGKKVVLDVGTEFCGPCKAIASYLSTNDQSHLEWSQGGYYPWWSEDYSALHDMVQNEEIYWLTILFSQNEVLTQENSAAWEETYPNEKIPVLADGELNLYNYLAISSYPAISVVDENMNFLVYSDGGPYDAFAELFPNN
jgi:thiol-disulfide isomerase/thioredoxin